MEPARTLQYRPLRKSRPIRLISLKPALLASQPIECALRQVSLEDCEGDKPPYTYEALSYTWGAKNGSVPILCDGKTLLVTPNCESALRHLRNKWTERVLWIDAICIDQSSSEEKSHQVPLMGEIYSLAKRVIIWLGVGLPGDEAALTKARIGGWVLYVRDLPGSRILSDEQKQWLSKAVSLEDIERIRRICAYDWFRRMWTMQEFLLADVAVFQIGRTTCPTASLYTYLLVAEGLIDSESHERQLFRMRNRALELVNPGSVQNSGRLISITTTVEESFETELDGLLSLLVGMAAMTEASDVRDKVYGMVGLLKSMLNDFVLPAVDYNVTAEKVFERFTRGCIQTTKTLWPLEIMARSNDKDGGVPSWVPNLRDPAAVCIDWEPRLSRKPHEDGGFEGLEDAEPGVLPVWARYLASVDEVYNRMPLCGREAPDGEQLRTACLSEWTAIAASLEEAYPGNYLSGLQFMTPVLNTIRNKHEPPASPAKDEEENSTNWLSKSKKKRLSPAKTMIIPPAACIDDMYDGAVLFRTACGLLGLCKGDVKKRDKVCQLSGGRFPYVLHRVSRPRREEAMEFRFVGIADVNGLGEEKRNRAWKDKCDDGDYQPIWLV